MEVISKWSALALLCCLTVGCAPAGQHPVPFTEWEIANSADGLRLTVHPVADDIAAGNQWSVRLRIQNVSDHRLFFNEIGVDSEFETRMLFDGEPARRTAFGNMLLSSAPKPTTTSGYPELSPGEAREYALDISRRYDVTLPGVYLLQVRRSVPKLGGPASEKFVPTGEAVSLVVQIMVYEPPDDFGIVVPAGAAKK